MSHGESLRELAVEKGVLVSTSSGNDGTKPSIMGNVAPWLVVSTSSGNDVRFNHLFLLLFVSLFWVLQINK